MRRYIILALCVVAALCVTARDRLHINDFTINPGETKQVEIQLDNDTAYTGLQADIYLPIGLTIEQENGEYSFALTSRKRSDHTISSIRLSNGAIRIFITSQALKVFRGTSGAVVVFNIVANNSFAHYNTIEMRNVIACEPNLAMHYLPSSSCYVSQQGYDPPAEGSNRLYINDFTINPGESKQVSILLDNATAFTALQADIHLPNGLAIKQEGGDYSFALTSRKGSNHTISSTLLPNGAVRFMIVSSTLKVFSGNSGAIVTFKVIADETFYGSREVVLDNVIATDADCTVHTLPVATCHASVSGYDPPTASDKLFIEDFNITAGSTKQVAIKLNNSMPLTALQADIFLPEGLTIEQEDGDYIFNLTNRKGSDHTISGNRLSSGAIRILIASPTLKEFSGSSGALVTFNTIADNTFNGPKYLFIKNVVTSDKDKNQYDFPDTSCVVSSSSSVPGDVNGDGVVTAADVTALYDVLLNNNYSNVVNGDQNGDGQITAADITAVYDVLLSN